MKKCNTKETKSLDFFSQNLKTILSLDLDLY